MIKVPVSVIIPAKNEAENLPRCLASVEWADEVWVVDSQSTDRSGEVVSRYGRNLVQFKFNGQWPKKKNWALENLPLRNDWVFLLDADEVLRPDAAEEIYKITTSAERPFTGYWINRRFMFMEQWLKHAYYPNWNLRLFLHRNGRFEKITEGDTGSGDNEVHEHVIVKGATSRLSTEMDHYAFPNIATFIEKHNRYSNWEARVTLDERLKGSNRVIQSKRVAVRRLLKSFTRALPFRPTLRFFYVYFWQRGILDGRAGYYFARLHATYEFLCVAKEYELMRREGSKRPRDGSS